MKLTKKKNTLNYLYPPFKSYVFVRDVFFSGAHILTTMFLSLAWEWIERERLIAFQI